MTSHRDPDSSRQRTKPAFNAVSMFYEREYSGGSRSRSFPVRILGGRPEWPRPS